jgi:hypothetical protein
VRLLLNSSAGDPVERPAFPIVVGSIPASAKQRRAAIAVVILFAVVAAALAPFADVQAPRVDAFVPVIQTVICVADLVTATLLFSQYSIEPRAAILAVASGYMASGLFAFLQTFAFPGGYAPTGIIGDGRDSSAWLFVFWHTCFPLGVLIYALLKGRPANKSGRPAMATVGATVAAVLVAFAALSWLATAGTRYLPGIYVGGYTQQTQVANLLNLFMWLWGSTALIVLFLRRGTVLDLWLRAGACRTTETRHDRRNHGLARGPSATYPVAGERVRRIRLADAVPTAGDHVSVGAAEPVVNRIWPIPASRLYPMSCGPILLQ